MSKRGKVEILSEAMQALNGAIDACSQMVVCHRLDPKFMAMRDLLNVLKDEIAKMTTKGMTNG